MVAWVLPQGGITEYIVKMRMIIYPFPVKAEQHTQVYFYSFLQFHLARSALLPLFQQLNNGLFHTLWRVAGGKVFAECVALEGDALRFFFLLGHDGPHDQRGQLTALGELLQPLSLGKRRRGLLAVHSVA